MLKKDMVLLGSQLQLWVMLAGFFAFHINGNVPPLANWYAALGKTDSR